MNTEILNSPLTVGVATAESDTDKLMLQQLGNLSARVNSYYRSKIFTSEIGINPLIAAASPIFAIVEKLAKTRYISDISKLHQDLTHEIKAFENKIQTQGYRSQIILAARYVLCAWIDEVILNTEWGIDSEWDKRRLVNNLQESAAGNQQFFVLLDRCSQDPAIYIDLLELMYLCLILGLEGDYRYLERGHIQLSSLIDNLYQCIRQQRGDFSKNLEVKLEVATKPRTLNRSLLLPILCFIGSIVIIISLYCALNYRLNQQTNLANQALQKFLQVNPASGASP